MNRNAAAVALVLLLSPLPPAVAQPAPPAAAIGAAPVAAPPAATPPRLSPQPVVRADADARNCLGFSTNQQIIRCAEKYLPQHTAARAASK
jgi:hypothetical protein